MRELIGIRYSPWTERARWALDHHRVPYRYSEHTILLGMPLLRWKLKMAFRDVTVPALIDGHEKFLDSFEIARHAEKIGAGQPLLPSTRQAEIAKCNELAEQGTDAIRALVVDRTLKSRVVALANLPKWIPAFLRPLLLFMVPMGTAYLRWAFDIGRKGLEQHRERARASFLELRALLKSSGGSYVLGEFTYADIALSSMVHGIVPPDERWLRIDPGIREGWRDPEFEKEFADLVKWRDVLFAKHRAERVPPPQT